MSFRSFRVFVGAGVAALALATPAAAATCAVPGSYATITAALADASCTTIQVAAGTYLENIVIAHDVTIQGAGQASTIIDGGANGRVVDVGLGLTVTINDLTVRNGNSGGDNGAGIRNGAANSPQPGQGTNLTLNHVLVTGNDAGDGFGGGIENNRYGTLTVNHSKISANRARDGAGLGNVIDSTATINDSVIGGDTAAEGNVAGNHNYSGFGGGINNSDGTMYINRSVIRFNSSTGPYGPGPGGGIDNDQTNGNPVLSVTDSTFSDNSAEYGGAIAGDGFQGSINVTGSTFTNNVANGYFALGGAIWLYNGHSLTMSNSTLSGNSAIGSGGGNGGAIGTVALYNATYGAYATLTNVTITHNRATAPSGGVGGGGISRQSGVQFVIWDSIISGNDAKLGANAPFASDCAGAALSSSGHNLFGQDGNANGCPANGTTDIVPGAGVLTSSVIDPLADNGGLTLTHKPVAGGLAVDAGDDAVTMTTDQIGNARLFGAHVDIGAVELAYNSAPAANAGGPYTVNEGSFVAVDGGGSSDAEQDALTFAWDLDNNGTYETPGQTATFSAAALDGPTSATVGLQVCDTSNACSTSTATVMVLNVAPAVTLTGASNALVGQPYAVNGSYTDPGLADTHTATIDWGDGNTDIVAVSGGTFTASHQFATAGSRTITACVADDDGGSGCASVAVSVAGSAGAITGGGLRTANNGRGGFTVTSNGTTISGELQFQSSLGRFHASVFTSLAISSDHRSAWFAGVGTDGRTFTAYVEDNGEPGRNDIFRLWIDGVLQNGSGALAGGNVQIK